MTPVLVFRGSYLTSGLYAGKTVVQPGWLLQSCVCETASIGGVKGPNQTVSCCLKLELKGRHMHAPAVLSVCTRPLSVHSVAT